VSATRVLCSFGLEKFARQTKSKAAGRLTGLAAIAGGSSLRRFYIHVARFEDVAMKKLDSRGPPANSPHFDIDVLRHRARAFAHACDVVAAGDNSGNALSH
jgi:hypothetical protein